MMYYNNSFIYPAFSAYSYLGYPSTCTDGLPVAKQCAKRLADLTDEETKTLLQNFATLYHELSITLDDSLTGLPFYAAKLKQLACLYPDYACIDSDCEIQRFYLLLAHFLVTDHDPDYKQNVMSSAHVGDSSVSYDTSFTSRLQSNPFYLWLSRTKYGYQLLTLLQMESGIVIV